MKTSRSRVIALLVAVLCVVGGSDVEPGIALGRAHAERSPPRSRRRLSRPVRGVSVGTWNLALSRRDLPPTDLREIRNLGATHISFPISLGVADVEGSEITRIDDTIEDTALLALCDDARALGFEVILAPQLEVLEGRPRHWRGALAPRDPGRFSQSYRDAIRHYANLAEECDAHALVVAHELTSLLRGPHRNTFVEVARAAREVFAGELLVVLNYDALDGDVPTEAIDAVGVSAYFPLVRGSGSRATRARETWARARTRLEALRARLGIPVFVAEFGCPSVALAMDAPWDYARSGFVDLEEQRTAYAAAIDTLASSDAIDGMLFWNWFGPGGAWDRHYTPRRKPAERELARYFAGVDASVDEPTVAAHSASVSATASRPIAPR